jgi:hypothetical protein
VQVSFEVITCQAVPCRLRAAPGSLVLSEFAGSAQSLAGAVRCNPWNTDDVADALHQALTLTPVERQLRWGKLYRYVTTHTSAHWALTFVDAMQANAEKVQAARAAATRHLRTLAAPPSAGAVATGAAGAAAASGTTAAETVQEQAELAGFVGAYQTARSRIIILGYEDVLVRHGAALLGEDERDEEDAVSVSSQPPGSMLSGGALLDATAARDAVANVDRPPSSVLRLLDALAADPRNVVVVASLHGKADMAAWFDRAPAVRLIAEGGMVVRLPVRVPPGRASASRGVGDGARGIVADGKPANAAITALRGGGSGVAGSAASLDRHRGMQMLRRALHDADASVALHVRGVTAAPGTGKTNGGSVGAGSGEGSANARPSVLGLFDSAPRHGGASRGPAGGAPIVPPQPGTPVHSVHVRAQGAASGRSTPPLRGVAAPVAPAAGLGIALSAGAARQSQAAGEKEGKPPLQPPSYTVIGGRWFAVAPGIAGGPVRVEQVLAAHIGSGASSAAPDATRSGAAGPRGPGHVEGGDAGATMTRPDADSAEAGTGGSDATEAALLSSWKPAVRVVLKYFLDRTPSSWVEEKENTLTWHYEDADPDLGMWQARQLGAHVVARLLLI